MATPVIGAKTLSRESNTAKKNFVDLKTVNALTTSSTGRWTKDGSAKVLVSRWNVFLERVSRFQITMQSQPLSHLQENPRRSLVRA